MRVRACVRAVSARFSPRLRSVRFSHNKVSSRSDFDAIKLRLYNLLVVVVTAARRRRCRCRRHRRRCFVFLYRISELFVDNRVFARILKRVFRRLLFYQQHRCSQYAVVKNMVPFIRIKLDHQFR